MTRYLPLFLLGIFYVLFGWNDFKGHITLYEPLILLIMILSFAAIFVYLSWLFFRDTLRCVIFSVSLCYVVLFSRTNFVSVKSTIHIDLRTSTFLIFLLACLWVIGIIVRRASRQTLQRFHRFLVLTFSVLILFESIRLIIRRPDWPFQIKDDLKLGNWKSPRKENIYFFLFDEYQGSQGLLTLTGYNNERLESFLRNKNFTIGINPHSTYDRTFFSMPSLFLMDTLVFSSEETQKTLRSGIMADHVLNKSNPFIRYLKANGYHTDIYSIFNIGGTRKFRNIPIGLSWLDIQLNKTLPLWTKNDILHAVPSNKIQKILGTYYATCLMYNSDVYRETLLSIKKKRDVPHFVFSHFLLPHEPALFDSSGNERSLKDTYYIFNSKSAGYKDVYVEQLIYANTMIKELVGRIDSVDPGATVIIASDHGSRDLAKRSPEVFNILWALRVNGTSVEVDNDDIELVNTFRILLNNAAGLTLPMLHSTPKY